MAKKYIDRTWLAITPEMKSDVLEFAKKESRNESDAVRVLISYGFKYLEYLKSTGEKND